MEGANTIAHAGIVIGFDREKARIRLIDSASCDGCSISSYCGKSSGDRDFTVDKGNLKEGDQVTLSITAKSAFLAAFWAYLLPFLLIVLTAALLTGFSVAEEMTAILSLLILGPYIYFLYRNKGKISHQLKLNVKSCQ